MSDLEKSKLWKLVSQIAAEIYGCLDELPEEEKWGLDSKLRGRSGDLVTWVGEGLGSIDPRDVKWALGKARSSLFAVEAAYRHACNVGLLTLDPELMVLMSQATKEFDPLFAQATTDIPKWFKEMEAPSTKGTKQ